MFVSLVEIIVFPSFLDFVTKSKKLENIMILTSDISKIQTFPRFFVGFYQKNTKKTI